MMIGKATACANPHRKTAQQRRRVEPEVACRLRRSSAAPVQVCRNRTQRADPVHVLKGQPGKGGRLPDHRDEPRSQQRMPAEIGEEIGVERNGLGRQYGFGGGQQRGLGLVARFFLGFRDGLGA